MNRKIVLGLAGIGVLGTGAAISIYFLWPKSDNQKKERERIAKFFEARRKDIKGRLIKKPYSGVGGEKSSWENKQKEILQNKVLDKIISGEEWSKSTTEKKEMWRRLFMYKKMINTDAGNLFQYCQYFAPKDLEHNSLLDHIDELCTEKKS